MTQQTANDGTAAEQRPELGLVCLTTDDTVRFRTITRKRLLLHSEVEQTALLRTLYRDNLARLRGAITFCQQRKIRLYRMSSAMFPFSDDAPGNAVLEGFASDLRGVGTQAKEAGIRLVLHPDQFVVLNSERPEVIKNSITILNAHTRMMDLLGLEQSPWNLMNIHGGKGGRGAELVDTIRSLPDTIRLRLTLENDEHAYGAMDIYEICVRAGVPMVFDAHHHVVKEKLNSYDHPSVGEAVAAARKTWHPPEWQVVHISNGLESFGDARHSDYICAMPESYENVPWIEVEAKHKERAIARLRDEWPSPYSIQAGEAPDLPAGIV